METPQIIAMYIENVCKLKGISVNKMLSESGAGERLCQNLKKGSYPSIDKFLKISNFLDCSVDYLLGRSENTKYNRLNDEGKAKVDAYINDLLANPNYTNKTAPAPSLGDYLEIAAYGGEENRNPKRKMEILD